MASGDVEGTLWLGVLDEWFEGAFFLEPCADAEAVLGRDKLRVDCVSRDGAELGVSLADEVDDVQEVGHKALLFVELCHVRVGDIPGAGAAFDFDLEDLVTLRCDEVVAFVLTVPGDVFDGVASISQVSLCDADSFLFDEIGHGYGLRV